MKSLTATVNKDGTVDLIGLQGTTWILYAQVYKDKTCSTPKDLTGFSVRGLIKSSYGDSTTIAEFTCTILEPFSSGKIQLYMSAEDSAKIPYSKIKYVYDVVLFSEEMTYRVLQGKLRIDPKV